MVLTAKRAAEICREWYVAFRNKGKGEEKCVLELLDVVDTIEALEAAQPKWISVEDRLPEDYANVIVYIASKKENVDSVVAITQYTHRMYGYNLEGWCSPWQYCFWDREVTHWMPIPNVPEDDNNA